MPVIVCHVSPDIGSDQYLDELSTNWWNLQQEDVYTDLVLVSEENSVRVHQAVLLPLSTFLRDLVPACCSCSCTTPAITLPRVQGNTLAALVELVYTGRSNVVSKTAKEECVELIRDLHIGIEIHHEINEVSVDTPYQLFSSPEQAISHGNNGRKQMEESMPTFHQIERSTSMVQPSEGSMPIVKQSTLPTKYESQKRKVQSMPNQNNDMLQECKKKKLNSTNQQPGVENNLINVQDILDADVAACSPGEGSQNVNNDDLVPDPTMVLNVQDKLDNASTQMAAVDVPSWRIIPEFEVLANKPKVPAHSMEGTDNVEEDTDKYEEETILKSHARNEQDEKRRKRWDIQRMRREQQLEKLKASQARRNKKDKKGGETKSTIGHLHSPEEITHLVVSDTFPTSVSGVPLPNLPQAPFDQPGIKTEDFPSKPDKENKSPHVNKTEESDEIMTPAGDIQ